MSSFGRWNDDDDDQAKPSSSSSRIKNNNNNNIPPTSFCHDNDEIEDFTKNNNLAIDISDLVGNPHLRTKISAAQAQSLPAAWRPENNNNNNNSKNNNATKPKTTIKLPPIRFSEIAKLSSRNIEKENDKNIHSPQNETADVDDEDASPNGNTVGRGDGGGGGGGLALHRFRAAANATRFTNLMKFKGMASPAHHNSVHHNDDDLTAYISAKEERKREKEAAKRIVQDTHVPIHVKQKISQDLRSRGAYRSQRQYGYSEPKTMPLMKRTNGFVNNNNNNASTAATSQQQQQQQNNVNNNISATQTANPYAQQHNGNATNNNSATFSHHFSPPSLPSYHDRHQQPRSGRVVPTSSVYEGIATKDQKQNNNNSNNVTSCDSPSVTFEEQQNQIQMLMLKQQQQQQQRKVSKPSWNDCTLPPLVEQRTRNHRLVVKASSASAVRKPLLQDNIQSTSLTNVSNNYHNNNQQAPKRSFSAPSSSSAKNINSRNISNNNFSNAGTTTTTSQYLENLRQKDQTLLSPEQLQLLSAECQKVLEDSSELTQNYKDRVRKYKEEIEQLTLTGETLRQDISRGSNVSRKYAELQQTKLKLETEKRQKEQRIKDLEVMISKMSKRLQLQEDEKFRREQEQQQQRQDQDGQQQQYETERGNFSNNNDDVHNNANARANSVGNHPTVTNGLLPPILSKTLNGNNNNNQQEQILIQALRHRVDELTLHRDALVKDREMFQRTKIALGEAEPEAASIARKRTASTKRNNSQQQNHHSKTRTTSSSSTSNNNQKKKTKKNELGYGDDGDDLQDSRKQSKKKNTELSATEKEWIQDHVDRVKRQLATELDKELREIKQGHEKALTFKKREMENRLSQIVNSQKSIEKKLEECTATCENQQNQTNDARMAQMALDTHVAEKQDRLAHTMEQRRANEQTLKKIVNHAGSANASLAKLRQELLVAEDVPVDRHGDEDKKRTQIRSDKTQKISQFKSEEQKVTKKVLEWEVQLAQFEAEVAALEKVDPARDIRVVRLGEEAKLSDQKHQQAAKNLEKAKSREKAAKTKLAAVKQQLKENEAQDQEIMNLTRQVEAKKQRLRDENGRNMELLEKLDRAERLLSMSGGLAG